jgi:hypothetical protein
MTKRWWVSKVVEGGEVSKWKRELGLCGSIWGREVVMSVVIKFHEIRIK